eukprot:scaffold137136_cov30-Tisochrysis_lutea.AAC.2
MEPGHRMQRAAPRFARRSPHASDGRWHPQSRGLCTPAASRARPSRQALRSGTCAAQQSSPGRIAFWPAPRSHATRARAAVQALPSPPQARPSPAHSQPLGQSGAAAPVRPVRGPGGRSGQASAHERRRRARQRTFPKQGLPTVRAPTGSGRSKGRGPREDSADGDAVANHQKLTDRLLLRFHTLTGQADSLA